MPTEDVHFHVGYQLSLLVVEEVVDDPLGEGDGVQDRRP